MKKLLLVVICLFALNSNAQSNEVKLDLLDILAFKTLDISYERLLNEEASVGLSVFVNFSDAYNEDFQLIPYFRQSFTHIGAFQLFGEVFASVNTGETTKKYTDLAVGVGTGLKHVSNNGYIFEINVGAGRNLIDTDISKEFVPRFGVSIGKQF